MCCSSRSPSSVDVWHDPAAPYGGSASEMSLCHRNCKICLHCCLVLPVWPCSTFAFATLSFAAASLDVGRFVRRVLLMVRVSTVTRRAVLLSPPCRSSWSFASMFVVERRWKESGFGSRHGKVVRPTLVRFSLHGPRRSGCSRAGRQAASGGHPPSEVHARLAGRIGRRRAGRPRARTL